MTICLRVWLGELELTNHPFGLGFGMDLGRPENVYAVMESLLADGEVVTSSRTSNRAMSLPVLVEGADMLDLADNEAALVAECEKPMNTLTVDPGDGFGPPTVFRTFRVQARHDRDDDAEMALLRSYTLEIQALPAAHSADSITLGAEFVADSFTVSDDCESTSGWTATGELTTWNPVAIAVDSSAGFYVTGTGSLRLTPAGTVTASGNLLSHRMRVAKSGLSINASGGGYLTARLRTEWSFVSQDNIVDAHVTTSGGGRQPVSTLVSGADSNGFVRLSWAVPHASTVTGFDLNLWQQSTGPSGTPSPRAWFDSIGLAGNSTTAQAVTRFSVLGSMRSEASFSVSASVGLGNVVLYSCPDRGDGFRPDLRRWLTSGSTSADANAINGSNVSTAVSPTFTAPAAMFRPGDYAILARMRRTSTSDVMFTLSAQLKIGSTLTGVTVSNGGRSYTAPDANYHLAALGVISLPPTKVADSANASVVLTATSTGTPYLIDELLVLPLEESATTWVSCGTGAPSATVASRLWMDAPSPQTPRGALQVGNNAGRLDGRYALPSSRGRHLMSPGVNLVYLFTEVAGGADLSMTYTPTWHSNAGK